MSRLLMAVGLAWSPASLPAQVSPGPLEYRLSVLACARFAVSVQTSIRSDLGRQQRNERVQWSGTLVVTAGDSADALVVEAWFDSLSAVRDTPGATLRPDPDGLIGGRYAGVLTRAGRYSARLQPFIPSGLAEVYDFRRVPELLWPPLPPGPLVVGESWEGDEAWVVRRLSDSTMAAGVLERYALTFAPRSSPTSLPDSLVAETTETEQGVFAWQRDGGLWSWARSIHSEVTVRRGDRTSLSTKARQEVVIQRIDRCDDAGNGR
ncbi:MAG: hypothetical protein HKM89_14020 [Gemmatimonadales bacterium]|nr:hypothetical protein [Gemmatimonadales bacterium]